MIRKACESASYLRRKVITASYDRQTVAIDGPVLFASGLPPGSAELLDWLAALPRVEWHTWSGKVLTIRFAPYCKQMNGKENAE